MFFWDLHQQIYMIDGLKASKDSTTANIRTTRNESTCFNLPIRMQLHCDEILNMNVFTRFAAYL